jgi:GH15 family glucan-1,4-alpha-glucosidase
VNLGYEEEAHAYMNWILHATQLTRPKLQVVYSVYGHASIKEKTLDWLSGYMNSRPVRVGNGADNQFQLDLYGEVLDAVFTYAPLIQKFDRDTRKFIIELGEVICKIWEKPDNGIWEVRNTPLHYTHSKVMAWVGLDRLTKLCRQFNWKAPVQKFEQTAMHIRDTVEQDGFNNELNSYTRDLNGNKLDASLLTLSLVGYCDVSSARMISSVKAILERLSKNDLIYRYKDVDDGFPGDEGSFGVCNFWLVENLAKAGQLKQAVKIFESMLKYASPAGLFSEEIDPDSHELLGNYPQGFTHIGLINAAFSLNEASQPKDAAI